MAGNPRARVAAPSARQPFTEGWRFLTKPDGASVAVNLPHDAMISEPRSSDAGTGNHGGYFPGGLYRYETDWVVPADVNDRDYSLFFEGVHGTATVSIDGTVVGSCASGYREFHVPLEHVTPGATAVISVDVDNSDTPNSRWYTGTGIYRPVWLDSAPRTRIDRDGVVLTTDAVHQGTAKLHIDVNVTGPSTGLVANVHLSADGVVAASGRADVHNNTATIDITLPDARTWSADTPFLYDAAVALLEGDTVLDEQRLRVGVRTVQVDAKRGLRVNGKPVLLRGACIHHDNGILGAVTHAGAERRRARILKDAGFNAIRSSHNPLSRAFLDACDDLGLYVMDELTDVWFQHKTTHDTAEQFEELWQADARAMVTKNRNRPSVIMHSIGNEIAETATPAGIDTTERLARFVAELDPTRPTTLAVNLLLNLMASNGKSAFDREQPTASDKKKATSTAANMLTAKLGRVMELVSRLPAADKASRDAFAKVDIAGYNYAYGRYRGDRKKYPNRVIVGSESMPGDLPRIWRQVQTVPGVIGDFMWTGWDYLGEAGIGVWSYGDAPGGLNKPYPALLAGPGAFDITGLPGAPVFLAQTVWGLLDAPAIAVRPLDRSALRANKTPWRTSDAVPSWSWRGLTGTAHIEVYSDDDQVELLINGRSLGKKKAGRAVGFLTRFRTVYEPGELTAIGYRKGIETGRTTLRSANRTSLHLRPEPTSGDDDLTFVWVEIADDEGTVDEAATDRIALAIDGPAVLAGFGSAEPAPDESYTDDTHTLYRGRALAIIRRTGQPGSVSVTATSNRHAPASITLPVSTSPTTTH